ncbi:MAG TPA: energy transducer TonB [Saprospiraceae bacterium]|nr:energy transducer TonB [Saprospiraceae bacterium]
MKFLILLFTLLTFSLSSISCSKKVAVLEEKENDFQKKETIYEVWTANGYEVKQLDSKPVLKGGEMSYRLIYRDFRYPAAARENGVGGRVEILVVVNEFGVLESMELVKGIGSGCDEEAFKSVQRAKEIGYEPATFGGFPVKVRYIIPVIFRLD